METLLYLTEAHGRTARDVAEEFARSFWGRPRKIRDFNGVPEATFKIVGGSAAYCVHHQPRSLAAPALYSVWRIDDEGDPRS